jgi:hypothetical protein
VSIFGDIWNKITGSTDAQAATPSDGATQTAGTTEDGSTAAQPQATTTSDVDVESILSALEQQKGADSNWRTSIVDLLKLLDLDSSLVARKELAGELNVHAGADGSAEQNIALHKAVMAKLEENGGKIPDSLKG